MARDTVKIPTKHYVGMVKRANDTLPLGFMTPYGEDAAAKKRMATVDSWAGQGYYGNTNKIEAQTIDNVPLSGFRLTSSIRSSDYGGADKWRIEDPRGFELEITSGNLARLLSIGMVDKGEIIDQCVWGRYGANNILLSTATDEYKDAVKNTEVAGKSALWSEVKPGDTVVLQNTVRGVWLGRMHPLLKSDDYSSDRDTVLGKNQLDPEPKMLHVIHVTDGVKKSYKNTTEELHLIASPKLSSIEPTDAPLTPAQAEVLANTLLTSKDVDITTAGYKTVLMLSFGKPKFVLKRVDVVVNSIDEMKEMCGYRMDDLFVDVSDNRFGKVRCDYNNRCYAEFYDGASFDINELRKLYTYASDRYSRGWSTQGAEFSFHSGKYFKIEVDAVTAAGNNIKTNIR